MNKETGITTAGKYARRIEETLCFTALILMALLPTLDALLRPFSIVIPYSRFLILRLFLVAGLFSAMITTREKEHISIAIIQYAKNEKLRTALSGATGFLSSFIVIILFWDSVSFIKYSLSGRVTGFIPDWVFVLAMPVAFAVMALRFAGNVHFRKPPPEKPRRLKFVFPVLAILLGSAAAFPAIAKLIWGFDPPDVFYSLVNSLYDITNQIKTPLVIFLIVSALSGSPIFTVIAGIALVMLQASGSEPDAAPIQIFSALSDPDIIAIPLFTLTGFFLSESKAGERLVTAFRSLFSWIPGGMIIAAVVICAFFTSFTGASGVTILALGGLLYTILKEKSGYPEKFSIGLLTSVGSIGLLFPPSLPLILVGATTNSILYFMEETINYSIIDFFLGALIPGMILVLVMIIFGITASVRVKIPVERFNIRQAVSAVKGSILELLLPLILISGYFSGILTLLEVSAVSVIYVFVVEVFINRDIRIADVPKVFAKAVPIIGGVLAILAMAKALSYAIIGSQVPERFAYWMHDTVESKYLFLLLLNLALLAVGCLMDIFSAILVVLPLIVPLGHIYGVDPVHLGIIFIINLEVGFLTPPVGMNLFLASYRFKKPFTEICRHVLPFLVIQLAVVLLVTYIPGLSSLLINLVR
jgi:tripartite ATP-independent transporter DctM subunit